MTDSLRYTLPDESATLQFGQQLAPHLRGGCVVYLHGELGAGKTTLVRGILQGMGHQGRVKSPTYTLVETYQFNENLVCHFDLYRLADPEELEYMGIRDYFSNNAILLVEWPERGGDLLPAADVDINLAYLDHGRSVACDAGSQRGRDCIQQIKQDQAKIQ